MSPRLPPALGRLGVQQVGRRVLDPALPWAVQRQRLDQVLRAGPVRRGTVLLRRVLDGVPTEWVLAAGVRPERTVVHFHGGGYCIGSAFMARAWAAQLSAQAGCQVILPEYRLAPGHRYPAGLQDARKVLNALTGQLDPASIVLSGDSAGGGLALSLLLGLRDADGPRAARLPAGCILLSPWLDLGRDRRASPDLVRRDVLLSPGWLEACARAYTDPANWADPAVSPLHAMHRGLPPLLIQAADDELLAPDASLLATRASAAGVDVSYTRWPGMWHDFALQAGLVAAADSALAQATWFVTTVTGR
jgi:epsilon-lactone hydrolase